MKRKMITLGIWITLMVWGAGTSQANFIQVDNVASWHHEPTKNELYVAFDLSWENSWRNDINWDAAWVFVKFRAPGLNQWEHAYLSTNSEDHIGGSGSTIETVPDGMGVFIYSAGNHTGTVNYVNNRLLWQYGTNGYAFAHGDAVEISVHAIEMVYVPEGPFYVGSGGEETGSFTDGAWAEQGAAGPTIPFLITDDPIEIGPKTNKLWGTEGADGGAGGHAGVGVSGALPPAFPTGYAAFYCMKYSITQGQYADFLNFLEDPGARYPDQYGSGNYRIQWSESENEYVADHPDRACGWLSWQDGASYAAWAGLRPMTELEYEKACRGPAAPVANEYAWGTDLIVQQTGHAGTDGSGSETATPANANCNIDGGIEGEVRVGIYAATASAAGEVTRERAGATYWGIMEMSGNLWERVVGVRNGRAFEGTHGDGTLDLPSDWSGAMIRGGARNSASDFARVSDRDGLACPNAAWNDDASGSRAVRSACLP